MKPKLPRINSNQLKADLYLQLSRMEEAGLTPQHALEIVNQDKTTMTKAISFFQKYLKAGRPISESGFAAGIFSEFDRELIHAGESSGNMMYVYQQLARFYSDKAIRIKQIKSKLYLPIVILVLFIFINPLPALISNAISASDYLSASFGSLIKLYLLYYLSFNLIPWLTGGPLKFLGLAPLVFRLQAVLPFISTWLYARNINLLMTYLGMMLASGIAISDAIRKAINTINNPIFKAQFQPVISSINNGVTLADSLRLVPEIKETMIQQILVGEESGRLAETILHFSEIDREELAAQDKFLAEWIPRIIYFVILVSVAYSMITSSSISSIP